MYKNVLCLVLGLIIGIRLTDFWDYVKWQSLLVNTNKAESTATMPVSDFAAASSSGLNSGGGGGSDFGSTEYDAPFLQSTRQMQPNGSRNVDLATQLYNSTRVLCWVLTSPENHAKRAQHLKNTWGQRCNKLLFMSTSEDKALGSIALPVSEGRGFLWQKTREALRYIYEHHFNEADWFLKADDDTYVIMENLRLFLYPYDTWAPIYFGCKFHPYVRQGYMSGGAGYVLSREALHRFAMLGYNDSRRCSTNMQSEDKELGVCLQRVGVVAGDSRDELGRERFLPLAPKHLMPNITSPWFDKFLFYKRDKNDSCCSHSAISFHYTHPHEFYILDYFLYGLRNFGFAVVDAQQLPTRLNISSMNQLLDKWRQELTDNFVADLT